MGQVRQLWLVRHGPTSATQRRAFASDEPLLDGAQASAARLGQWLPADAQTLSSPAVRCRETAAAAGLEAEVDSGLAQVDIGCWRGRRFADVHAEEPEAMSGWLADPDACPHGGESLAALYSRTSGWLDGARGVTSAVLVAITHSEIIRAAILHALDAPLRGFWQLEVAPLSITELHLYDDAWNVVRVNWIAPV
jgi:broad specificity phosphatase PhoE